MLNTLYHHDTVKIQYDKDKSLLTLSWFDDAIDNVFMEVVRKMYELTLDLDIEMWLIDASHAFAVKTWDQTWKCEAINLALEPTHLRKIARIISHDIAYEAKINTFTQACSLKIKTKFFTDEEGAFNWLLKEEELPQNK
jgi:hypothetical protein